MEVSELNKKRVLMKNVCYLSAQVLQMKYKNNVKIKYKNNVKIKYIF